MIRKVIILIKASVYVDRLCLSEYNRVIWESVVVIHTMVELCTIWRYFSTSAKSS